MLGTDEVDLLKTVASDLSSLRKKESVASSDSTKKGSNSESIPDWLKDYGSLRRCLYHPNDTTEHTMDAVFALEHVKNVYFEHLTKPTLLAQVQSKTQILEPAAFTANPLDEEKAQGAKKTVGRTAHVLSDDTIDFNEYYSNHPPILLYGPLGSGAQYVSQAICNTNNLCMLKLAMDYIYQYCNPDRSINNSSKQSKSSTGKQYAKNKIQSIKNAVKTVKKSKKSAKNEDTNNNKNDNNNKEDEPADAPNDPVKGYFDCIFKILEQNAPSVLYVAPWELQRSTRHKLLQKIKNRKNKSEQGDQQQPRANDVVQLRVAAFRDTLKAQDKEYQGTDKSLDTQYSVMSLNIRLLIERIKEYNESLRPRQAFLVQIVEKIVCGWCRGFGSKRMGTLLKRKSEKSKGSNALNEDSMFAKFGVPKDVSGIISKYLMFYPSKFIQIIGNSFEPWNLDELECELFPIKLYCNLPRRSERYRYLYENLSCKILPYNLSTQEFEALDEIFANRNFHAMYVFVTQCHRFQISELFDATHFKQVPRASVLNVEEADDAADADAGVEIDEKGQSGGDAASTENGADGGDGAQGAKESKAGDEEDLVWVVAEADDPDAQEKSYPDFEKEGILDKVMRFLEWERVLSVATGFRPNLIAKTADFTRFEKFYEAQKKNEDQQGS